MFYTTMNRVHQNRTLKPRYSWTQATMQKVTLDESYAGTPDIFPGSVLTRLADGRVKLCTGDTAPAGLCANWCAPVFGIDEVRGNGTWDMSMCVMSPDAVMAVSAPAYDVEADWNGAKAQLDEGKYVFLKASGDGLLTVEGNEATENTVCRFIGIEGTDIYVAGLL